MILHLFFVYQEEERLANQEAEMNQVLLEEEKNYLKEQLQALRPLNSVSSLNSSRHSSPFSSKQTSPGRETFFKEVNILIIFNFCFTIYLSFIDIR